MPKKQNELQSMVGLVLFGLLAVAIAAIGEALQTWSGRLILVLIFGGGAWLAIVVYRWWRKRNRIRAQTLGELLTLTPTEFEHAVAQLLEDQGYRRVRVTGKAGDRQADVTAIAPSGCSVVVQCKRYSPGNKVGSPAVQSFIGMAHVHHKADRGMFVTTSTFTQPARNLARQHGIHLIEGSTLVEMIVEERKRRESTGSEGPVDSSPPPLPPPPPSAPPVSSAPPPSSGVSETPSTTGALPPPPPSGEPKPLSRPKAGRERGKIDLRGFTANGESPGA